MKFEDMGLSEETLQSLKTKGFEEPTPIQEQIIPLLLANEKDIIGQAQTGTGKTAAFAIPLLERLKENAGYIQALVLTPTRELALQVSEEIASLKGSRRIYVAAIYGGQSYDLQLRQIKKGVDILVGTPGRILDHLGRKKLHFDRLDYVILDEADEMLNMGFIDDVEEILKNTNSEKRMLLFSATMPRRIMEVAKKFMTNQTMVKTKNRNLTTDLTEQIYFEVSEANKFEALCRIIDLEPEFYGLVFCRTKVQTDEVANHLRNRGYDAAALHGDISQAMREKIIIQVKQKQINVLVATDVAARGLDITELTHVINFSIPQNPESYVHRIGRTGRAGKRGTAITFVNRSESRKLNFIQNKSGSPITKKAIPRIGEIISARKERIIEEISKIVNEADLKNYFDLAKELIKKNTSTPEDFDALVKTVAALVKFALGDQLDASRYTNIDEKTQSISADDARLFIGLGKKDNITARKIVQLLKETADLHDRDIREVVILDTFSFVTVPDSDADRIISDFKRKGRGKKPLFQRASMPKQNIQQTKHRRRKKSRK